MERWIFGTFFGFSLAAPMALMVFDGASLTERDVPMIDAAKQQQVSAGGPVDQARAESYMAAARELLRSPDPKDRVRACRLIAEARRAADEEIEAADDGVCEKGATGG